FHLGRPDVLPVGDLGIRRIVMRRYGLDELPAPAELESIAEPWRPYRTLACRYLWRSLDATPAYGVPRAAGLAEPLAATGALNRRNLFLFRDAEGRSAAAGGDHVRVVDLEARTLQALDEVNHRALNVGKARTIDQQADALVLVHAVAVALLVERERVLEAGAASPALADTQYGGGSDRS